MNPLPFTSHFVDIDNLKMHYVDEGEGHPILLLHGNPTWSFLYRNLIFRLRPFFRLIAPDHLGCGLSQRTPGRRFCFKERVQHLEDFIETLGLKKFSLVLHDWGGPLGAIIALNNKERISSITFLNTLLSDTQHLPRALRWVAQGPLTGIFTKSTKAFLYATLRLGAHNLPKYAREGFMYPYQRWFEREAVEQFVRDIPLDAFHKSASELSRIDNEACSLSATPIQMVWGMKDPCFRPKHLSRMLELFPHARVKTFADASHLVLEDVPGLVEQEIVDFLVKSIPDEMRKQVLPDESKQRSILDLVFHNASLFPEKTALIRPLFEGDEVISFRKLGENIQKYRRGLRDCGLRSGQRVLFLSPLTQTTISLLLAVMAEGACPVIVDPGIGLKKLKECIISAAPEGIVASGKGFLFLLAIKKSLLKVKWRVSTTFPFPYAISSTVFNKYGAHYEPTVLSDSGDALYAFTSGATGTPKAVAFTYDMLSKQVEILRTACDFRSDSVNMSLLPIFCLFDMALGITSVIPPLDPVRPISLNPELIADCINKYSVTHTFGAPTLLKKIGLHLSRVKTSLLSLKRIIVMGAPVGKRTIKELCNAFGEEKLILSYGATEALPVTMLSVKDLISRQLHPHCLYRGNDVFQGTFLGTPLPEVSVKILPFSDDPLEKRITEAECQPGRIGEIVVSGPQVSPYYSNNEEANLKGKAFIGEMPWHLMSDTGYKDEFGNLFFCGRTSHRVKVGETVYYPIPIEEVINVHPWVMRSALVFYDKANAPALVIEPTDGAFPHTVEEEQQFVEELLKLTHADPSSEDISHFFFNRCFPVDPRHNAKIARDKLQEWVRNRVSVQSARLYHKAFSSSSS